MALFQKLPFILFILISCGQKPQPVQFPVRGTDAVLLGVGREASGGLASYNAAKFKKPKKLEYRFESPPVIAQPASMEIEYSFNADGEVPPPVAAAALEMEGNSWVLPAYEQTGIIHYAVPILDPGNFNITLNGKSDNNSIKIHSIEFKERWFGFFSLRGGGSAPSGVPQLFTSPFVKIWSGGPEFSGGGGRFLLEINPPENFSVPAGFYPVISADLLPGKDAAFDAGKLHLDLFPALGRLSVPAGLISPGALPLALKGERVDSFARLMRICRLSRAYHRGSGPGSCMACGKTGATNVTRFSAGRNFFPA